MMLRGRVAHFDAVSGRGVVRSDDGAEFSFHCVDIADGTRSIDVGAHIVGERKVGHQGRDEVAGIYSI